MKLPNGDRADLGTKLEDYTLDPLHRDGRHKARVFESVLGISLANIAVLRDALREAAKLSDSVISKGGNGFDEMFVLRFRLRTDKAGGYCVERMDYPPRGRLFNTGNLLYSLKRKRSEERRVGKEGR